MVYFFNPFYFLVDVPYVTGEETDSALTNLHEVTQLMIDRPNTRTVCCTVFLSQGLLLYSPLSGPWKRRQELRGGLKVLRLPGSIFKSSSFWF